MILNTGNSNGNPAGVKSVKRQISVVKSSVCTDCTIQSLDDVRLATGKTPSPAPAFSTDHCCRSDLTCSNDVKVGHFNKMESNSSINISSLCYYTPLIRL